MVGSINKYKPVAVSQQLDFKNARPRTLSSNMYGDGMLGMTRSPQNNR